jgi:predicted GH43/DUF377 family glycosyl hydrolase
MKLKFSKITLLLLLICTSCTIFEEDISEEVVFEPIPKTPPAPKPLIPTSELIQPDCFEPQSLEPQVKSDDFFVGSKWNAPSILKQDDLHYMFVSSSIDGDLRKTGIYRLSSTDGITWERNPIEPIISNADLNWIGNYIDGPSVVYFNEQFHLFFQTHNGGFIFDTHIGHAISDDGVNWTIQDSPLLSPSRNFLEFYGLEVSKPGAAVRGNELLVYFSAIGFNTEIQDSDFINGSFLKSIGLIETKDGETWSEPINVLIPDQSKYPRSENGFNSIYGFSSPQPMILNNEVFLFFEVVHEQPTMRSAGLTFAYSTNGKENFDQKDEYIFETNDFWWSQSETRSPSALLDGDQVEIWFAGHQTRGLTTTLGIGMATCDLRQ